MHTCAPQRLTYHGFLVSQFVWVLFFFFPLSWFFSTQVFLYVVLAVLELKDSLVSTKHGFKSLSEELQEVP